MNEFSHPGRREAAVAVAVAVIVLLVAWLVGREDPEAPSGDPTALSSQPGDDLVDLDVAGTAEPCTTGEVLYSQSQKTERGVVPVSIVRTPDGDLRLCDSFGEDSPSVAPVEYADSTHAVRLLSNGRQSYDCDGDRLDGLTISHWLSVSSVVDRAELRFVIDDAAGPWFSSKAKNDFLHLHGWLGKQNPGAVVAVQIRVLDAAGDVVPQTVLPTSPQTVSGCAGGGIQLG